MEQHKVSSNLKRKSIILFLSPGRGEPGSRMGWFMYFEEEYQIKHQVKAL